MTDLTVRSRRAFSARPVAETIRRDQLVTAVVGLGCAVLGVISAWFANGTVASLWVGLMTLCVTPGCAIVCWHLTRDRLARSIAVLAASLTWTILVTTTLALLQVTSLGLLVALTAGAGGIGSAAFLVAGPRTRADARQNGPGLTQTQAGLRPGLRETRVDLRRLGVTETQADLRPRRALASRLGIVLIVVLVVAVVLWVASLFKAHGQVVGSYGLLPVLGAPFIAAVVLTVGVLAVALWFLHDAWPAAVGSLGLLLLEFFASDKLLAVTPLYSYLYKHIGVVDYVFHGGPLNDPTDVYQQWPGFFAAGAALVRLSGRSPLTYANWDGLLFEALNAVTLFIIARRFSGGRRIVPYIAVLLYITADWEGQEYYSPQTLAFELSLLFQFLLLPLLEPERLRRLFLYRGWLSVPPLAIRMNILDGQRVTALGSRVRVVGLALLFAAIIVTHQLSPYIVFAGIAALFLLGVLRHRVLLVALIIMLAAYPLLHLTAIEQNPMLNVFDFSNAVGQKGFTEASPPQVLGSGLAKVVCVGLWGATAVCGLSYRRRMGNVAIPLVWAVMPISLVLVSNYGGEGIYRSFLFSSPWCALVIAMRLAELKRAPMLRLGAVGLWGMFAALASAQAQNFGQYPVNVIPMSEVQASEYFFNNAPAGSTLVEALGNFPGRVNAKYVLHNTPQAASDPSLDDLPQFTGKVLDNTSPKDLAADVTNIAEGPAYLVIAPSMYPDLAYFGAFSPGTLPTLEKRLESSNYWKLWYQRDGTLIFQAVPQGVPAAKKSSVKGTHSAG